MQRRLREMGAIAATLAAMTLSASPALAGPAGESTGSGHQPPAVGQTVDIADSDGKLVGTVHTMTANEIAAKGLSPYAGTHVGTMADTKSPPKPTKSTPAGASSQLTVGGCWTFSFKQPGWLGMDGYGSEDWCGSGGWITYATPGCWGTDGWYPTYNYLGCTTTEYYGTGYNVADTMYNFDFCIAWWGGGCAKHRHLWDRYRFGATGGVWLISNGG